MYKIIVLMGQAGSGKDTLMQKVLEYRPEYHEIVSCTTRPMREGEAEGVNYYYYTPDTFALKVINGEMLECTCFNDWFYGTSFDSVRNNDTNIGVFNPAGVEALLDRPDVKTIVFYIKAADKTRMLRQLNREEKPDVHEIVRRFKADWMDFAEIDFDYIEVDNDGVSIEDNAKKIIEHVDAWLREDGNK